MNMQAIGWRRSWRNFLKRASADGLLECGMLCEILYLSVRCRQLFSLNYELGALSQTYFRCWLSLWDKASNGLLFIKEL